MTFLREIGGQRVGCIFFLPKSGQGGEYPTFYNILGFSFY